MKWCPNCERRLNKHLGSSLERDGLTTKEAERIRGVPTPYYYCDECRAYYLAFGSKIYEYSDSLKWVKFIREFEKPEHIIFT